ncbi:RNA polymerase sigma-70 factor, ECF subfamily [Rhodoferax sp. OV413]|uniref:RNA polymerase sigma factor n=1 Tax=Rhodoferax sp. OV413 TaxID=1855285 RepID=UPI00087F74EC|nr:RNA polymerase sigma factor [Rhodoferax sp. OV413]SDO19293.1 RNA polymerase sigma-70 factor, ECF subfamily [Rhodoferax sp. OV413]
MSTGLGWTVFDRYYRELLNFLVRQVADRATAADLTQESYARVYAAQASGSSIQEPRALLYRTARNLVIDHQRHGAVRAGVEVAPKENEPLEAAGPCDWEPEVALSSHQGVLAMVAAIDKLPPRCREAFMLNRFDGLGYAQVAAQMGISVKMVEQHIKLALDSCERCRRASAGGTVGETTPRTKLHRSKHL